MFVILIYLFSFNNLIFTENSNQSIEKEILEPFKTPTISSSVEKIIEKIPVWPNGLLLNDKKNKSKVETPHVIRTCAFDSFCQIIASATVQNPMYEKYLKSLGNDVLNYVIKSIGKDYLDIERELFIDRTKILLQSNFIEQRSKRKTCQNQDITINILNHYKKRETLSAEFSVIPIVNKAFSDAPSVQRFQSCSGCNVTNYELPKELSFKVDLARLTNEGYSILQNLIEEEISTKLNCRNCMASKKQIQKADSELKLFSHVYLDTSDILNTEKTFKLSTIPTTVHILDKQFIIAGFSGYKSLDIPKTKNNKRFDVNNSGHFTAFCLLKDIWYEYDDLSTRPRLIEDVEKENVQPHFILYVFKV